MFIQVVNILYGSYLSNFKRGELDSCEVPFFAVTTGCGTRLFVLGATGVPLLGKTSLLLFGTVGAVSGTPN